MPCGSTSSSGASPATAWSPRATARRPRSPTTAPRRAVRRTAASSSSSPRAELWYRSRMPMRCAIAVILGAICFAAPAHADPRSDIAAKARAAMASYDAMDYDTARKLLAIAKRAKLDKDPIVARVYLDLGIAQLASSDQEAAKVAFLSAAQIDPKIAIDPAYKSAELVRMLDDAKAAAGDTGGGDAGD